MKPFDYILMLVALASSLVLIHSIASEAVNPEIAKLMQTVAPKKWAHREAMQRRQALFIVVACLLIAYRRWG